MSLVGNLEDLGLGDILQIVSLSRKSGELVLQSQGRTGKIIFQNGQVTLATSTVFRENLGDLMIRRGVTDIETIKQALEIQRKTPEPTRIGTILSEHFSISKELIDSIVREQIEKIVYSFFAWGEGTFAFELGDTGETAATHFDPFQFMLDQGLNPQWLAMEGSRILDEKLHRGESLEEEATEPLLDLENLFGIPGAPRDTAVTANLATEVLTASDGHPLLILVDDDEVTRMEMADILGSHGMKVIPCSDSSSFLRAVDEALKLGHEPFLLIDLLMPRLDGSGVLGGLELAERVKIEYPGLSALLVTDHPTDESVRRVVSLGFPPVLTKPQKIEVREPHGLEALERLGQDVAVFFLSGERKATSGIATFNLGEELRLEFGESPESRVSKGPETPGLHLLRGMLQELNNPALGGGIILLVLRFASELMNRAVIFLVKEDEIVGLGQFGIEPVGVEVADVRVRRMKIPRGEGSIFEHVLQSWSAEKKELGRNRWDDYLCEQLGGGRPSQIFLGPIISEGKVVAILYGDNVPENRPICDTESLEIFLSQAGLAMEKALLERRLRNKGISN